MEIAILTSAEGQPLRAGPGLVRRLIEEMSGLDRVLERRECAYGAALETDLFPGGAPARVLPSEVRQAVANRLETSLRRWVESPAAGRGSLSEIAAPLHAIADGMRGGDEDQLIDYLFPSGVPASVSTVELLRAFRFAASREQRSLVRLVSIVPAFEGWDSVIEHEIAGRLVLVTKLWVVALRWFALAAARIGAAQVRSFEHLVQKWLAIESRTRLLLDA